MKVQKFTDPITGTQFDAPIFKDHMVLTHAITGEKVHCRIVRDVVYMPLRWFDNIEQMTSLEVCKELNITRARLSQLISKEVLKPIHIGNEHYFLCDQVLEYKRNRKNGRPKEKKCLNS